MKKGEGRTLKAGGMWVYDNEIASTMGEIVDGGLVEVHDFDGYFMGIGYINRRSKITVRMMSRRTREIDRAFIEQRVRACVDYRKHTVDMSSCRLIFGEADFLPGIVIDKFSDVLVVESLALGIDRFKPLIVELLKQVLKEEACQSAVFMKEAMPRCVCRRAWSVSRALSEKNLTPRYLSWKTA